MYIAEVGTKLTLNVTFTSKYEYMSNSYAGYGVDYHTIYIFTDGNGNQIKWDTTSCMHVKNSDEVINKGARLTLSATVKAHKDYKGTEQTIITRPSFVLVQNAKSYDELMAEKRAEQMASLNDGDVVMTVGYKQYKEHYSDCETIKDSYDRFNRTIKIIVRSGRLVNSGVRGQHYHYYKFHSVDGKVVTVKAITLENAQKRLPVEYPHLQFIDD